MRKVISGSFILAMLATVAACNTMANWVDLGHNDTIAIYADPSTLTKAGKTVKMWKLIDYKKAPEQNFTKPFKSIRVQTEYDCEAGTARTVAATYYADNMGKGEAVLTEDKPKEWGMQNLNDKLWKMACELK